MKRERRKIMNQVENKLRNDYQDIQMGLGEGYFEELVEFIIEKCEEDLK